MITLRGKSIKAKSRNRCKIAWRSRPQEALYDYDDYYTEAIWAWKYFRKVLSLNKVISYYIQKFKNSKMQRGSSVSTPTTSQGLGLVTWTEKLRKHVLWTDESKFYPQSASCFWEEDAGFSMLNMQKTIQTVVNERCKSTGTMKLVKITLLIVKHVTIFFLTSHKVS